MPKKYNYLALTFSEYLLGLSDEERKTRLGTVRAKAFAENELQIKGYIPHPPTRQFTLSDLEQSDNWSLTKIQEYINARSQESRQD